MLETYREFITPVVICIPYIRNRASLNSVLVVYFFRRKACCTVFKFALKKEFYAYGINFKIDDRSCTTPGCVKNA